MSTTGKSRQPLGAGDKSGSGAPKAYLNYGGGRGISMSSLEKMPGLQALDAAIDVDKVVQVLPKLIMVVVAVALERHFLDGSTEALGRTWGQS